MVIEADEARSIKDGSCTILMSLNIKYFGNSYKQE